MSRIFLSGTMAISRKISIAWIPTKIVNEEPGQKYFPMIRLTATRKGEDKTNLRATISPIRQLLYFYHTIILDGFIYSLFRHYQRRRFG
jgi:hypothetical protein